MPVSAVDCVQPALQHAREQLFTRFRWGQWSRLALVGILAAELHVGGCNFGNSGSLASQPPRITASFCTRAARRLSRSIPRVFPSTSPSSRTDHVAICVAIVLGFVFLYISSVFRFILFDSVLRRHCSIGEGWGNGIAPAADLPVADCVSDCCMLFLAVLVGVPLAMALAAGWATDLQQHVGRLLIGVILLVGLFLLFVLAAAVVQVLARISWCRSWLWRNSISPTAGAVCWR